MQITACKNMERRCFLFSAESFATMLASVLWLSQHSMQSWWSGRFAHHWSPPEEHTPHTHESPHVCSPLPRPSLRLWRRLALAWTVFSCHLCEQSRVLHPPKCQHFSHTSIRFTLVSNKAAWRAKFLFCIVNVERDFSIIWPEIWSIRCKLVTEQ